MGDLSTAHYFSLWFCWLPKRPSLLYLIKIFSNTFLTQSSASVGSKHTVYMSDDAEKTPDEKPSPEQSRKAPVGKKTPLFTCETRTIIWGLQARAVQVCMKIRILAISVSA